MNYLKFFKSLFESEATPKITTNAGGVAEISKLSQYQSIPELAKQLEYFENNNVEIGPNSKGANYLVKLVIAQLKKHGIEVADVGLGYTTDLVNAIKGFQSKNGLDATGNVNHATYNALFGVTPVSSKTKTENGADDVIEPERYDRIVAKIIANLEGGYYHPNMMKEDPKKFKGYDKSGETMFGLDRHAGHDTYYSSKRAEDDVFKNLQYIEGGEYEYKTPEAKDFWTKIDAADAKNKWKWGYRGGDAESELRQLAGEIMKPYFTKYFTEKLSPEAQQLVKNDDRLLFHFIYATWNGQGWFKKFADKFNEAVSSGITDSDRLYKIAIDSRLDSNNRLIAQTGEKIAKLLGSAKKSWLT